jgi:polar amino acid transport system substrate-binding protein
VGCVAGGFAVGIVGALLMARQIPGVSSLVRALLTFTQMTPLLLQIYVVFFGLGAVVAERWGIALDATAVVVVCISVYAGAANAYALVGAAEVLFARVPNFELTWASLPRALRMSQGPVVESLVNAVKATGMASAIAVPEVVSASTSIMAERGNTTIMMNVLMAFYIILVIFVVRVLGAARRRFGFL